MRVGMKATDWFRRNDPLGATVKGAMFAVFGIAAIASGGLWLGLTFMSLGLLSVGLQIRPHGRSRGPSDRWGTRR